MAQSSIQGLNFGAIGSKLGGFAGTMLVSVLMVTDWSKRLRALVIEKSSLLRQHQQGILAGASLPAVGMLREMTLEELEILETHLSGEPKVVFRVRQLMTQAWYFAAFERVTPKHERVWQKKIHGRPIRSLIAQLHPAHLIRAKDEEVAELISITKYNQMDLFRAAECTLAIWDEVRVQLKTRRGCDHPESEFLHFWHAFIQDPVLWSGLKNTRPVDFSEQEWDPMEPTFWSAPEDPNDPSRLGRFLDDYLRFPWEQTLLSLANNTNHQRVEETTSLDSFLKVARIRMGVEWQAWSVWSVVGAMSALEEAFQSGCHEYLGRDAPSGFGFLACLPLSPWSSFHEALAGQLVRHELLLGRGPDLSQSLELKMCLNRSLNELAPSFSFASLISQEN